jgi:serine/threonine protein kinase
MSMILNKKGLFLVTEYIEGMIDGEVWLKRKGKLDLDTGLEVGLEIAKGLQVAHCAKIYHLDLKPANILLKRVSGKITIKIIDFGLSQVATSMRQQAAKRQSQIGLSLFGQQVFGTLDYASPEQLDPHHPEKPGAKSDIYGFGTTMYHLLTGQKPNPFIEGELPDIPTLRNLLSNCVKQDPSQRPQSVRQLVNQWKSLFPQSDVFNVRTIQHYKERSTLQGHRGAVWSIAFSPDSCLLASGSNDGAIILWNVNLDEVWKTLTGHGQAVYSVAFSPDGCLLASSSKDQTVKLWDVETGQVLQTLSGHEQQIHSVIFNPTMCLLVSSSRDQTILWKVDPKNSTAWRKLPGYETVAFSPNGNLLALADSDKTIKFLYIDPHTTKLNISSPLNISPPFKKPVKTMAFTPDGNILALGSHNIILWEVSTGQKRKTLPETEARTMAFDHNGHILAANGNNNTLNLWDSDTGRILNSLRKCEKPVCSIAFSPCGRFLAAGDEGKSINLWERK